MTQRYNYNFEHYNIKKGFSAWAEECRQAFATVSPLAGSPQFFVQGYSVHNLLEASLLGRLMFRVKQLEERCKASGSLDNTHEGLVKHIKLDNSQDQSIVTELCQTIFQNELNATITQFFQSHYMVFGLGIAKTYPGSVTENVSYRWHRDAGPTPFLKLIIYLDECHLSGAGTEVINMNTTYQLAEIGYDFPDLQDRESNLNDYFSQCGLEYKTELISPTAGEGLLLRPVDVLHRGVFSQDPNKPRYTLTLVIAPSTMDWRCSMQKWPLQGMQEIYARPPSSLCRDLLNS